MQEVGERLAVLEHQVKTTNDSLLRHLTLCEAATENARRQIASLERLAYIGLGATMVLSGIIGIVGSKIFKLLGG